MEVGYLIGTLSTGGAETMLLRNIRYTDSEPTVFWLGGPNDLESRFRAAGATVVDLDVGSIRNVGEMYRARSILAGYDLDVLHAHLPYAAVVARVAGRAAGIGTVVTTHHNVTTSWGRQIRAAERLTRPLDSHQIAVSNAVRENQSTPFDMTPWSVIYNGIDVDGFAADVADSILPTGFDGEGPVFLNVGRCVSQKGQWYLVEAMERVIREFPDSRAILVGQGPLKDRLESYAAKLGVEDNVRVMGHVPDIHGYYALADVFVLPSLYEGHPVTALEAMAASLPVVGSRVSGIEETITDETGRLIPPKSPTALADGLVEVTRGNTAAMGRRAHERVKTRFDIGRMVAEHDRLYERLVSHE